MGPECLSRFPLIGGCSTFRLETIQKPKPLNFTRK
jgi:hypothetical protein